MYISAASKGDVYIRTTAVRCLRPRSTYTVFLWRSLFTQGRGRDCMKSGPGVVIRYSSTHEKALPDGSFRRRMELHRASRSTELCVNACECA